MQAYRHKFSIEGLSEAQRIKLETLLNEISKAPFMEHRLPPKANWEVYSDSDAKKAYGMALEAAIAANRESVGNKENAQVWVSRALDQAISATLRAAHFAEPLHGRGKKSEVARAAYERAEIEGLYLGRDGGTKIAQAAGKAAGLAGMLVATDDIQFQLNEKEEAMKESAEYIEAIRRGYLIAGKVNDTYYVACVGPKKMDQLLMEMKGLLGNEARQ